MLAPFSFLIIGSLAAAQVVPVPVPRSGPAIAPSAHFTLPGLPAALPPLALSLPRALSPALARVETPSVQVPAPGAARPVPSRQLPGVQTGDLVFLDLDCGALCDAMAETTRSRFSVSEPRLAHAGIIEVERGAAFVWEAWPYHGVRRVPLRLFLERVKGGENEPGGYYLGRLDPRFRELGRAAAERVRGLQGRPFDDRFDWGGPGMYCSKLINEAFAGSGFFAPRPMYFGEEGSPARETWRAYFASRGRSIPDGQPGVSPLGLYLEGRERLFAPPR